MRLAPVLTAAVFVLFAACSSPPPPKPGSETEIDPITNPPTNNNPVVEPPAVDPKEQRLTDLDDSQTLAAPATAGRAMMRAEESYGFAPAPCCYNDPFPQDRENYAHLDDNPIHRAAEQPVSTFSIDVDTASYANVRRFLKQGRLPPQDAVRVEELINYFDYAYAPPRQTATPFAVSTEMAPTPWNPKTHLLRIGIQGWKPQTRNLPPSNLVFLVDVSGSMAEPNKLPLVRSSLKLLTRHLRKDDRISLVTYAGSTEVVLEPTPGDERAKIEQAIDRLGAGGSTAGAAGITLAYQQAEKAFMKNGNNRVLLATDGDFNVGIVDFEQLKDLAEEKRKSGIALTTLGFGTGNYNDQLMEQLADAGNGNYGYIDSLMEGQKLLVDQREATLFTIARDVKIQVEFNPVVVAEYRLVGYENRMLKREDFNNDKIDAGEIGAGHTVTALYEVALTGSGGERVEPLRYSKEKPAGQSGDEIAFLRLRYKNPDEGMDAASKLIEEPIRRRDIQTDIAGTSASFRLAASVAAFGQLLKGGNYTAGYGFDEAVQLARGARGDDRFGYVGEYVQLVQLAGSLSTKAQTTQPTPTAME
ncbi:MAG: vWA domain-containing protein [Nevskiales bacterium]